MTGPEQAGASRRRAATRGVVPLRLQPAPLVGQIPKDHAAALAWLEKASLPVIELDSAAHRPEGPRRSLRPASMASRRRPPPYGASGPSFYNALGYAVELGLLDANPIDRVQWKAPEVAQAVRPPGRRQTRLRSRRCSTPCVRSSAIGRTAPGRVLRLPVLHRHPALRSGRSSSRRLPATRAVYRLRRGAARRAGAARAGPGLPATRRSSTSGGASRSQETDPRAGSHWTDDGRPQRATWSQTPGTEGNPGRYRSRPSSSR